MSHPFVSVVTPTYNRVRFIPYIIECYKSQTYPKQYMEWIILDDGTEKVGEIIEKYTKGLPNIRYIALDEKLNIGGKRNRLNAEAKGDIIVCMDDDDWYSPQRVAHVVKEFIHSPGIELAGSSKLFMHYSECKTILQLGPYSSKHATNGTMAYRSSYAKSHLYDDTVTHAEERSFLDEYKHPMIQLDPMKVMLVISHSENTFNKKRFLDEANINPHVKKTNFKIKDFIKDKKLREFYSTA